MKRAGVVSTAILFLLLGTTVRVYAQHEQRANRNRRSNINRRNPRRNSTHSRLISLRHVRRDRNRATAAPITAASRPTALPMGASTIAASRNTQGQVRGGFVQSRAKSWDNDHRTWRQRGGYNGYRIPDERFRAYFGRDHFFRIYGLPLVFVGGYPRFQYDGYWVTFVDPWPDTWPADWYQTDDVYLDYTDDGYYLYDRNYPGIGIAVTVSF